MKQSLVAKGVYTIIREAARHVLRRPVVGVAAVARTDDERYLLIRRGDTGEWALPGGTIEWGQTLTTTVHRELDEEAGVEQVEIGRFVGAYSAPFRDSRFHAVTLVVEVRIEPPTRPPRNPIEILEVRLFRRDELPPRLGLNMTDMLEDALAGRTRFE
ncbi:MAG: NUDIX domain-containing protein [Polyangiaceae bacterium]